MHFKENLGLLTRYGTILALILLFLSFSLFIPGFVDPENLMNILRQIALLLIIAEGFTMVLIVGELDLSFANVASLASVLVAGLIIRNVPYGWSILLTLLVGAGFGLLNGFFITRIGISSLITTLSTGIIASGLVYLYTKGVSFYGNMPEGFLYLGRGTILGIPFLVLIMLLVLVAAHILVTKTVVGIYMQATGGNPLAAYLSGVPIAFYKLLGMVICGVSAAFTGILLTARLGAANPEGAAGFLMEGFAIVLLGQTVFTLGKSTPIGTFVGALIIGILNNGLTLLGAQYYVQDIVKGIIMILSVVIASLYSKREGKG
jgi:ribose/xylose/arabinose/galactoside ABC-type transport system permease subunit